MLSDSPSKVVYDLASTTPITDGYEVTFTYFNMDEVKVYLEGDDGQESEVAATNYSVDESDTTAVVVFKSGYSFPEGSVKLVLMRLVEYEQESDYRNGDKIDADKLERSLDLLTAMVQQIAEMIDRTIQKPKSETGTITLPTVDQRAGTLIGFDDEGQMIPVLTSDIDQKLSQALAAEEGAIAAAGSAEESKDSAAEYLSQTTATATKALQDIEEAKDAVIQLIEEANLEQIEILTQKAEELEESMTKIEANVERLVLKVQNSESSAAYSAASALLWANKAIEAANLAQAVKNSCNTILGQVQSVQTTIEEIQSDIQIRQSDIITRQNDVIDRQGEVSSMKNDVSEMKGTVSTDKGVVAVDKASVQILKDQTVAAKNGADAAVQEMEVLKTQITALAGSTTPGMTYTIGNKVMVRNFYVKNGRTYFYDTEAETNTQEV